MFESGSKWVISLFVSFFLCSKASEKKVATIWRTSAKSWSCSKLLPLLAVCLPLKSHETIFFVKSSDCYLKKKIEKQTLQESSSYHLRSQRLLHLSISYKPLWSTSLHESTPCKDTKNCSKTIALFPNFIVYSNWMASCRHYWKPWKMVVTWCYTWCVEYVQWMPS